MAISVLIHPYLPWKTLPSAVLDMFEILNFGEKAGTIFTVVARRLLSSLHTGFIAYFGAHWLFACDGHFNTGRTRIPTTYAAGV